MFFEVSAAAELVSEMTRNYIAQHRDEAPFISTACPTIVRMIRVRFPTLIPRLLPLKPPVEIAAEIARKKAMEKNRTSRFGYRDLFHFSLSFQGDLCQSASWH